MLGDPAAQALAALAAELRQHSARRDLDRHPRLHVSGLAAVLSEFACFA